jgi:hypothetical protein
MSTYAQVSDFTAYTELTTATPSGGLQNLVDLAERDIDKILPKTVDLSDMTEGIAMTNVTGGTWLATQVFGMTSYTTTPIPFDIDGSDLITLYLCLMEDPNGNQIPYGSWIQPEETFIGQNYAFGPLPTQAICVQATSQLGSQRLPLLTVDTTELEGADLSVTVTQLVGGGLKCDPNQLAPSDQMALNRAVCAQAEYRDLMGPEFFVAPQFKMVSGPEFNVTGRRPRIGPRVFDELASTDLVQRGARAVVSTRADMAMAYQPIGTLGIPDDWRAF